MRNTPIRFNDPTGHRDESGYEGTQRRTDCNNERYKKYCNSDGNLKSAKELADMRKPNTQVAGAPFRSTPTPTMNPTLSSFLTESPTGTMATIVPAYVPGATSTSTPVPTSTPTATPMPNNEFPWEYTYPSNPLLPDFAPNADDIWDIFGNALPLMGLPATNLNQIVNNAINNVNRGVQFMSNVVANTGMAVNEAIGNGPFYGPVMPIFYLPADPFPALFGLPNEYN